MREKGKSSTARLSGQGGGCIKLGACFRSFMRWGFLKGKGDGREKGTEGS